jgi:signal peptidase I
MITKCKKCGCDALIKNGEWYECPKCGAMMFDVSDFIGEKSPTKMLQMLDEENVTIKEQSQQPDTANIIFKKNDNAKSVTDSKKPKKEKNKNKKSKKNNTAKNNEEKQKKSKLREAISFMTPIVVALIIAIFLKTCIFANIVIPTGSMLNTIQEGDRIIASRLAYINDEPQRYDIIIFKYPDDETQLFAKRIIALPGETIEVKNGIVYITDKNGNKSTARTDFITNCIPTGNFGPYTVPLGSYFVMGDNRNDSWDSRYWDNKTVKKGKIIGKVKFRYFPNPGKIE